MLLPKRLQITSTNTAGPKSIPAAIKQTTPERTTVTIVVVATKMFPGSAFQPFLTDDANGPQSQLAALLLQGFLSSSASGCSAGSGSSAPI